MNAPWPFFTIGHSTHSVEHLAELLTQAQVTHLIDVRSIRRSRTNPQFNQDVLPAALAGFGIACSTLPGLGGRRSRQHAVDPATNGFWDNASFHNYADYALQPEFHTALDELRQLGHEHCCAIMCAEAVWWRCHRRIIADYLLVAGESVYHILPGKIEAARLTQGAHIEPDGHVTYPAPQSE